MEWWSDGGMEWWGDGSDASQFLCGSIAEARKGPPLPSPLLQRRRGRNPQRDVARACQFLWASSIHGRFPLTPALSLREREEPFRTHRLISFIFRGSAPRRSLAPGAR